MTNVKTNKNIGAHSITDTPKNAFILLGDDRYSTDTVFFMYFFICICGYVVINSLFQNLSTLILYYYYFQYVTGKRAVRGNSTFLWVCTISELYVRSRPVTTGSVTFKGLHTVVKYFISIHFCIIKWLETRT